MYLDYYEGTPVRTLSEDGIVYIPTFFVRLILSNGSYLIYGERFRTPYECDQFIQNFNPMKFDEDEWIE